MISKKALQTLIYSLLLALVVFLTAKISHGFYFYKVVPVLIIIIIVGLAGSIILAIQGKRADLNYDEREQTITEKSMKFTFYVMSFTLTSYWGYDLTLNGQTSNLLTFILLSFWLSFLTAYGYNKFRY